MNDIKKDPFEEYIRQVEPGKKELGYAWYTAIGLQAVDGLKETVSNKLTPAFDMFSKLGIKAVNSLADKLSGINVDKITNKISIGMVRASSYIKKAVKIKATPSVC